jgi:hypothetical protein
MTQTVRMFPARTGQELEDILLRLVVDGHTIVSVCPTRDWTDPYLTNRWINDYLVVYSSPTEVEYSSVFFCAERIESDGLTYRNGLTRFFLICHTCIEAETQKLG